MEQYGEVKKSNFKVKINDKMYLPLKLIITDDIEVTNIITKATNRQTEVKLEAFYSTATFHKNLEDFYASFDWQKLKKSTSKWNSVNLLFQET